MLLFTSLAAATPDLSLADYGVLGVALGALGWFTVWSEKRRDLRDKENRVFMVAQHDSLVEALKRGELRHDDLVKLLVDRHIGKD